MVAKLNWVMSLQGVGKDVNGEAKGFYGVTPSDGLWLAYTITPDDMVIKHDALVPLDDAIAACNCHHETGNWPALIVDEEVKP
jgi:hypothetical protein